MALQRFDVQHVPMQTTIDEIKEIAQEELEANHWDVDIPTPEIELVPFFVFHFDSFSESEEEGSKIRNVDESSSGESSLNAISNTLDEVVSELAAPEVVKSEFTASQDLKVSVKTARFSLDEAKVVAQIKIAAQEKLPKANVHISGMRLVYIPYWVFRVELEEDSKIAIRINAVSGELEGEDGAIPFRGKTRKELFHETVSDLHSPSSWVDYFQNFVKDIILLFSPDKEHPNRRMIILILVVIAILLLLIGFVKLPTPN